MGRERSVTSFVPRPDREDLLPPIRRTVSYDAASARAESLPAWRYQDVLSAHTGHTAFVGDIPEDCATAEGVIDLFRQHGVAALRAVVSDCPDDGVDKEERADTSDSDDSDDDGGTPGHSESPSKWWALVLFESKDAAAKARCSRIVHDDGYGEEVTLRVEMVKLKEHLHASLAQDAAWNAGSGDHDPVTCRKSNLLASAWRELCTVRVDQLSKEQANEQRLQDAFSVCGELLEVSTHEPAKRLQIGVHHENASRGYWALLRFHHPESAGRAMTSDVRQSGSDWHEDAHMRVMRPAGLWHSVRWRKLNNHRKQEDSWVHLAYGSKTKRPNVRIELQACSRSLFRMRAGSTHGVGANTGLTDDQLHQLESEQDEAVAYTDSALTNALQESDHSQQPDEIFAVLRRRAPNVDERAMQAAVAGAKGQPMYLCKFMHTGKYRWVSYHVLTHSVVAMGLVQEYEERLHTLERSEAELREAEEAAAAARAAEEAAENALKQSEKAAELQKLEIAEEERQRALEAHLPVVVGPRAALLIGIMRFGRGQSGAPDTGSGPHLLWPDLSQSLEVVEEKLQQSGGNLVTRMELLELSLALRAVQFGLTADPPHCRAHAQPNDCVDESEIVQLVVAYNAAAVEALPPGQRARDTLWKAELLCAEPNLLSRHSKAYGKLRATTLNNLACCYRGMNQPHAALKYWKQTLSLQESLAGGGRNDFHTAGTHLNLAELYGSTGFHHGAFRHAQTAAAYLLRRFDLKGPPASASAGNAAAAATERGEWSRTGVSLAQREIHQLLLQAATSGARRRKLALLVAAFERLAASLRGLRRRNEAAIAAQTSATLRDAAVLNASLNPAPVKEHEQQNKRQLQGHHRKANRTREEHSRRPALGGSVSVQMSDQRMSAAADSTQHRPRRRHSSGLVPHSMNGTKAHVSSPPGSCNHALPTLRRHRFP